jgi:hypothetical protein
VVSVEEEDSETQADCPSQVDKGESEGKGEQEEGPKEGCEGYEMIRGGICDQLSFLICQTPFLCSINDDLFTLSHSHLTSIPKLQLPSSSSNHSLLSIYYSNEPKAAKPPPSLSVPSLSLLMALPVSNTGTNSHFR